MTKFKNSSMFTDMRGKSGATSFTRDRTGQHMRLISGRIKSTSYKMLSSQSKHKTVLNSWTMLSNRNRNEWNELGKTFYCTDRLGNTFPYCGRDIYQKFSRNLLEIGEKIKSEPPKNRIVQHFNSFSAEITVKDNNIQNIFLFIKPAISKNTKLLVFATHPLKQGVSNPVPKNYKRIGYLDYSFNSGGSILHLYKSVFPSYTYFINQIGFYIKPINLHTGIASNELYFTVQADD